METVAQANVVIACTKTAMKDNRCFGACFMDKKDVETFPSSLNVLRKGENQAFTLMLREFLQDLY
eukprot:m.274371 g.274371  ORF g.274371 m.274371 type:complete len:65 (-) comp69187_c0_seq1:93-287(-)